MPELSAEEFLGTSPGVQSGNTAPAKSGLLSTEAFLGVKEKDPLSKEALDAENTFAGALGNRAAAFGKNVAAVGDMVLGLPGQALAVGLDIGGRMKALASGGTRQDAELVGKELAKMAPEALTNPVQKLMKVFGYEQGYTDSDVNQVMDKAMGLLSKGGEWVERNTRGALTKADTESLVNTALFALGARGTASQVDPAVARLGKPKLEPVDGKLAAQAEAAKLLEAENAPLTLPTGSIIPKRPGPEPRIRASTPDELRTVETAEAKARREKRADVRAAFLEEPDYATRQQQLAEGMVEQRALASRLPPSEEMARTRGPATTVVDEAPRIFEADPVNGLRVTDPKALDSGLAKMAQGRAFDLTAQEKVAVNASKSEWNRPNLARGAVDKDLITAMAVGATGLGLAMAYKPDKEEAALAIGGGALLLGRGRTPLTVERLEQFGKASPLGAILAESPTTLLTLERLPPNRFEFPRQMIEDQLKRADVTKAEKDVFAKVLEGAGDKITAKDLMLGVKKATGDFELGKKTSDSYANYGLDAINRVVPEDSQFERAGIEQATIQRNPHSGLYDILDPDGQLLDSVPGLTGATPDDILAEWRGRAVMALDGPPAETHIWQSPIKLGDNNHFNDPNYFGHTRVFEEGGVRHVVEIQSDLAQKAGKALAPEEVQSLRDSAANNLRQLRVINSSDIRSYLPDNLEAKVRQLEKMNPDVKMKLGQTLESRGYTGDVFELWDNVLGRVKESGDLQELQALRTALSRYRDGISVLYAEHTSKLASSLSSAAVEPMLKNWHKRLVREELADAARSGERQVRFATADTVAKVEGWPDEQAAWDRAAGHGTSNRSVPYNRPETRFHPEHQGIYNRYKSDVEKFLRQLGGKGYTDPSGHTWLEVPVEGSKTTPAGPRSQQFGGVDPELAKSVALIGGGAALTAYLSSQETRAKNAAIGAAITGLALFAKSRVPAVAEWAESAGRGVEYGLGLISTRIGEMSPALLRRMREHERLVLTRTNENLNAVAPFVESLRKVPSELRDRLNQAILTNDSRTVVNLLAESGNPALVKEWGKVRGLLDGIGKDLMQAGRLKGMLQDYYPRVVVDVPGLLKALGQEDRSFLQKKIDTARQLAMRKDGRDLSPVETSQIINQYLKSRPSQGKPGFLKKRSVDEVTAELAPFYAPASESLPLYVRAVSKELERARFFGDDLVRDPETGLANIDLSIGNVVNKERLSGKIDDVQAEDLRSILTSRFGPGEKASAGPIQTFKNLANAGLLGHLTSAAVQLGDIGTSVAAYGILPTVKALQQIVTRDPARMTVRDLGLVDHISEEIAGGARKPVIVGGRELSSAKFLEATFKLSGFSLVDQLGKATAINAAFDKYRRLSQTAKGIDEIKRKYGEAYSPEEINQLVADFRSKEMTDLTKGVLFSELSDLQPISKLEVPQAYLDMPNGRVVYMLKTYMLKQADIVRRNVVQEFKRGNAVRGTEMALRYGLALGIAGASTDFIRNWMLGRDDKLEWGDIPANMMKTFGWSEYVRDKARQGKPLEATAGLAVPPYQMFDQIMARDPKAIQYLPVVGRLLYAHQFGGAEKANEKAAKKAEREAEARYYPKDKQ